MSLRLLATFGRHGAALMAIGIFVGLAAPPLAALLRPFLGACIFVMTTATLLGIDPARVLGHLRRPGRLLLVMLWIMLASPLLAAAAARLLALPPHLASGLVLWAASPPIVSMPAIALLLGLDAALALVAMVACTFAMPFVLPPLVLGLIGMPLDSGILSLMRNLGLFVSGAAVLAYGIRRFCGAPAVVRHALELRGISVLFLFLFGVGVMDGMLSLVAARPWEALLNALVAFAASLVFQLLGSLFFFWSGRRAALTIGLIGGNHNLAIVWAMLSAAAANEVLLFLAAVQLPIYVLPALMRPLYRRLNRADPASASD